MTKSEKAAVREFKVVMTNKLSENDYKGGWQEGFHVEEAIDRIDQELNELKAAIWRDATPDIVLEEAADVANFAMMIADIHRKKWHGKPK